jgi:hypothetical protein
VGGEITLEGLIRARVARLPEAARHLLQVVAVSGRPVGEEEACRAAGAGEDSRTLVARLEAARFVRGTLVAGEWRLETYHDRIRETVVAGLPAEVSRDFHGRLAQALEESGRGDPEEMAGHFEGAGELRKAGAYYAQAADRAAAAVAFDHAAELYHKSVALRPVEGAEARELRKKLGGALANAGRGAEAGPVYLVVSEGAEDQERFDMLLNAADQFLLSGRVKEGVQVLETLLHSVGLRMAGGRKRALFGMILERVRMRLRGLHFREQTADSVPPMHLRRLDVCELVSMRFVMVDIVQQMRFMAKYIRLSLQTGEPSRVAIALVKEAITRVFEGRANSARAEEIWKPAVGLAGRINDPLVTAKVVMNIGCARWSGGEWKKALSEALDAEGRAAQAHVTHALGLTVLQHIMLDSRMMLGHWREIGLCVPVWLQDARRRGDRFATSVLLVHSYVPCLAADRPEEAEAVIRQAWEEWPQAGNVAGTYWSLFGRAEAALYRGDTRGVWEMVRRERKILNRSTLYDFVVLLNLLMTHLQARTALAAAAVEPPGGWLFSRRARLLRSAARDARRIERRRMPWSDPLAKLIRAGLADLRGDRDDAVSLLAAAEREHLAADQELYAAAARRQRGRLLGGEEGQALVASADAWMADQDIRNPARIAAMLAPGFADDRDPPR